MRISLNWVGTIRGPKDSPYEGGLFYQHQMDKRYVSLGYPQSPPEIKFSTPIIIPMSLIPVYSHLNLLLLTGVVSPT